jgi:hypothetical protein
MPHGTVNYACVAHLDTVGLLDLSNTLLLQPNVGEMKQYSIDINNTKV